MDNQAPDLFGPPSDEVVALAAAACDGTITPDGARRLESLLRDDPRAQRFYVAYLDLHGRLLWRFREESVAAAPLPLGVVQIEDNAVHTSPAHKPLAVHFGRRNGKRDVRRESPMLGLLRRMVQAGGESPVAAALTWTVMAIFLTGAVLTLTFIAMIVFGEKGPIDRPGLGGGPVAQGGDHAPNKRPAALGGDASSPVARLVRAADCQWEENREDNSPAPKSGDDLLPGRRLTLKSGLAQIYFQGGAATVLEGPATLEIRSKMGAYLQRGKFTVAVENPLARGFEVRTPGMKYTDLGTEFGVLVAQNGEQEVHVFRGKVQAEVMKDEGLGTRVDAQTARGSDHGPDPSSFISDPSSVILSADQGIRVPAPDTSGKQNKPVQRIAANDKQFVRSGQVKQIVEERSPEFRRWKQFNDELCKRSDLVAYYDFQPDERDRKVLRNRAKSGTKLDGRIEGAKWTDGPLPGKQALEFSGRDDRVRVNIPDSLPAVTAVVWIRIQELPNAYNSILMSDRWYERVGACHWQVSSKGAEVDFEPCPAAKVGPDPQGFRTVTHAPTIIRDDFQTWRQLAVVYDSASGSTTFYRDGQEFGAAKISRQIPLVFGPSQIGNWEPYASARSENAVRYLPARIGELYLLSRALPAADVKRLYEEAAVPNGPKSGG